jgi:hypothetical protein
MPPQNQPPENQPPQNYAFSPDGRLPGSAPGPAAEWTNTREFTTQPQLQAQPAQQVQPEAQAGSQPGVSRRSLLRGGIVGGGIGLAVAAGAGAAVAVTRDSSQTSLKPVSKPVVMAPMAPSATEGPLVLYIADTANGVIDVFAGTGATQVRNPALVTQLLNNLK